MLKHLIVLRFQSFEQDLLSNHSAIDIIITMVNATINKSKSHFLDIFSSHVGDI